MAEFVLGLADELPATLVGIAAALFLTWLNIRPKLPVFFTPKAEFDPITSDGQLPSPTFNVESLLIRNGNLSKPVTNIEITLVYQPAHFSVKPHVRHSYETLSNGNWLIKLEKVQPREQVKLDVSYFGPNAPAVLHIRSSEGPKTLEAAFYSSFVPQWRLIALIALAAIGFFVIWRLLWAVVQAVIGLQIGAQ